MNRRAKIVCTLGPAVASGHGIAALVEAGMDVARLNFSHGTHEDHSKALAWVRQAAEHAGRDVAVLADLQGGKIRLGAFAGGRAEWASGTEVVIDTDPTPGGTKRAYTTHEGLSGDLHPGNRLLVDDGNIVLEVTATGPSGIVCRVVEGGTVSDNKGISIPGVEVARPSLTDKDLEDLAFALSKGVDMVAMSFVKSSDDIAELRKVLAHHDCGGVHIVAKIERPGAVARLGEIVEASDAIMVARGDLGVEMPLEQVPLVQKEAVRLARAAAKPVIVATQMLESMRTHSRPTRAEASDVANAVFDGSDALMLSVETSTGAFPHAAVHTMARIIHAAEESRLSNLGPVGDTGGNRSSALAAAAAAVATNIGARVLVAFTQEGGTARRLAQHRPAMPLVAFTPNTLVRSQLAVSWGVETFIVPTVQTTDEMVTQVDSELQRLGRAGKGDWVVIVAGTPPGVSGTTNTLRVHRIGDSSGA